MIKIMITLLATLFFALIFIYWLVAVPKASKLQSALETKSEFDYQTSLLTEVDPFFPEKLLLRRVIDSNWITSGGHTNYELEEYKESSMSVVNIKPDAFLKKSLDDPRRILIGRLNDQGSGMHGWHVTFVRQGENAINFERHQRYFVWIEKEHPQGFNDEGEPISKDPKRWYFAGLADVIAEQNYQGYVEPVEGDRDLNSAE